MASFYSVTAPLLSFLNFLFLFSTSAGNHYSHSPISKPNSFSSSSIPVEIQEACKASRDPPTCQAVLVLVQPKQLTIPQIIQSALEVSSQNLNQAQSMVKNILDVSTGNINRTNAAKVCIEVLCYSEHRLNLTAEALPRGAIKDARAWMSAAMVYQYDCWSALKYVNGTFQVNETMAFLNSLIGYSSNALGMMVNYDNLGNETGSWSPPKTERDGFWELGAGGGFTVKEFNDGVPRGLKPDVTVCKAAAGGCDYETVQQAVNSAPENGVVKRFVIWIKAGLYNEIVRVPLEKRNLVFLGDGMGKTVITGSRNVGQLGVSTYDSATVGE